MAGVNKAILLGNLGRDPEIRHFDDGSSKAAFSLATSKSYNDRSGERVTKTEWHNVVLWRGLAKTAERYLTKGKQVYVEGEISTRSYTDKNGQTRYITEIIGDRLVLLGARGDSQAPRSEESTSDAITSDGSMESDELPF